MKEAKLFYAKHSIDISDVEKINQSLDSGYLNNGPALSELEKSFANYIGSKYAVAVSSGTAGLHLAALVMAKNEENVHKKTIITTPLTFISTASAFIHAGFLVDFVDIDPKTLNIDIRLLRERITLSNKNYAGIIPVHFAGLPADLEGLSKIAQEFNLWVIEDAAHSIGGENNFLLDGKWHKSGDCKLSDISVFSFHPAKHITSGEGGIITTNNDEIAKQLRLMRNHCLEKNNPEHEWEYDIHTLGFNYRISEMQCALATSQLSKIDYFLKRRIEIAKIYSDAFCDLPIQVQNNTDYLSKHAYHLYLIRVKERDKMFNYLKDNNIIGQIHYKPIHLFTYFQKNGFANINYPESEKYYQECLSLPIYPDLSIEDQDYVIKTVRNFFLK